MNLNRIGEETMNFKNGQQTKKGARLLKMLAVIAICSVGAITQAAAQISVPPVPDTIKVQEGNTAFLVGHAIGSQGYTCLPTVDGGTAWNPSARPEATLFAELFGQKFEIITHFQSINDNPKQGVQVPLSGNATWQGSLDSSRVWAVKSAGINPDSSIEACPNTGSIQCLLLTSVGNAKGPTGGSLLANTTFIHRLNTRGGAVPTSECTVGQTQLVPYSADYYFYHATKQ
jgi:hypothetical protein